MKLFTSLRVVLALLLAHWVAIEGSGPAWAQVDGDVSQSVAKRVDHGGSGRELTAAHRWKEAELEYRALRNEQPDSAEAVVLHAQSLIELQQPFDAAFELQKFLLSHPDSVRVLELHAVLTSGALHDSLGAEADLERCVSLDPTDFLAWKSLGDLYLSRGNQQREAIASFRKATELRPKDAVAQASLAYSEADDVSKAAVEERFRSAEALSTTGDTIAVQTLYGRYFLNERRFPEAVAALSRVLAADPQAKEALGWRAQAYAEMHDLEHAKADASTLAQASPNEKQAPLLLLRIAREQRDDKGVEKYSGLVSRLAQQEEARGALVRTLKDALNEAEPLLIKGAYAEAAPHYETVVKLLPTFYEAYFDLGVCYSQTGRLSEAEADLRKYLAMQPASPDGHAALGVVLAEQGNGAAAMPELAEAIQIDPGLVEARKALANLYLQSGETAAAQQTLEPAADSKDVELLTLLAEAQEKSGNRSAALTTVQRALSLEPSEPKALQLRQQLLAAAGHP